MALFLFFVEDRAVYGLSFSTRLSLMPAITPPGACFGALPPAGAAYTADARSAAARAPEEIFMVVLCLTVDSIKIAVDCTDQLC
jgi:hypothetical protein